MTLDKLGSKRPITKRLNLLTARGIFEDSIFNGFIPYLEKTENFVNLKSLEDLNTASNNKFSLWIEPSDELMLFHRKVYSFLDMLGDIGGLYDCLFLFVGFLVSSYNAHMFDLELVKTLFKFQKTLIISAAKF